MAVPTAEEVPRWVQSEVLKVSGRGRIAASVVAAYSDAR
jgi:hypothetical protein